MSNSTQRYTREELHQQIEEEAPHELSIEMEEGRQTILLARKLFAQKIIQALENQLIDKEDLMEITGLGFVFKGVEWQNKEARAYGVWTVIYEISNGSAEQFDFSFELLLENKMGSWSLNREITDEAPIDFDDPNVAEA